MDIGKGVRREKEKKRGRRERERKRKDRQKGEIWREKQEERGG